MRFTVRENHFREDSLVVSLSLACFLISRSSIIIVSHKSNIHDKEDDENQSINQKLKRGENLENDNQEHNQDEKIW